MANAESKLFNPSTQPTPEGHTGPYPIFLITPVKREWDESKVLDVGATISFNTKNGTESYTIEKVDHENALYGVKHDVTGETTSFAFWTVEVLYGN